jgi:hypothetical protein
MQCSLRPGRRSSDPVKSIKDSKGSMLGGCACGILIVAFMTIVVILTDKTNKSLSNLLLGTESCRATDGSYASRVILWFCRTRTITTAVKLRLWALKILSTYLRPISLISF